MRGGALIVAAGSLAAVCSGCSSQQVSLQGYNETAIVSADGKTITVGPYPASTDCEAIIPVARESKTQVALFLEDVTPWHGHRCVGGVTAPNYGAVEGVFASSIRLRDLLGNRKLVDGVTGRAIAWISSRLVLRPARGGYQLTTIEPTGYMSGTQGVAAGATQRYSKVGDPNGLVIVQSAGRVHMPGPGPGGWVPIRVRGHPGRATRNLVTWQENGLTDYIQVLAADTRDPQILTTQQLIALADTATSYSPGPVPNCCPPR